MPPTKTSLGRSPALLWLAAAAAIVIGCANRGMEAPTEPFLDGSGGSGAGGEAGAAAGGTIGTGGSAGQRAGSAGGSGSGAGGTGATSTGGVIGGTGGVAATGGVVGTGGVVSTGGVVGTGGVVSSGGTGGASTGGVAGGTAGQGGGGGLSQWIVSIDFIGGRTSTGGTGGSALVSAPAMASSETAGIKPATNWNGAANVSGTLASLRTSDGSVTTASVTWSSTGTYGSPGEWTNAFTDAPGDVRMMNGYLDPTSSGAPATVKVSGLPAAVAGSYDVYVYAYGDIPDSSTRTYQYAIGSATFTVSQTGPSTPYPGLTQATSGGAGNYFIFRKVSGAAFTLTATPGTGAQSRAPVNAIQIVWPSGS